MEKEISRQLQWFVIGLCAMIVIVIALIIQFMGKNNTRITEQNQRYLEDAASQSAKNMNEFFLNSSSNLSMISYLYGKQLKEPQFDYEDLDALKSKTPFSQLYFVDVDGTTYTGDGKSTDCSGRDYYTEGVMGKSGVCYVDSSMFTGEGAIVFYTPLYFKGEIIGVIAGNIDENLLKGLMTNSYFGFPSKEYLCLRDGTVVAAYKEEEATGNLLKGMEKSDTVSRETFGELKKAFDDGTQYSFTYSGEKGMGNAYVSVLEDDQWVLMKTFSSSTGRSMIERANHEAGQLEIQLIAVFAVYIVVVMVYYTGQNSRLSRRNKEFSQIVDSVKVLYSRFVMFDLENDRYEYMREGDMTKMGIPGSGKYSDWLEEFPARYITPGDAEKMHENLSFDKLRASLNKNNRFVQYEYSVGKNREQWEKISLIKLNMEEDETKRVLAAVEDVTELRKNDQRKRRILEEAFQAAEIANNAKSDFLSRMSHDIRTPMNAIIGLTAIAEAYLDDRERVSDCLGKITASGKHLLSLINEVLDMSKIESGNFSLSEADFNLAELIDDVMNMIQISAREKNLNIRLRACDISHEDVVGDRLRLEQVFSNIMSNAVKYTGPGGNITVTLTEKPSSQRLVGRYEFVFEDNGIGMSREFLDRIFVPFERAEDVRVSKVQGTGLGMAIVQNIVRMMDGDIKVESEPGKGSRFTIVLSLKLQDVEQEMEERLMDLMGRSVLVADNDEVSCQSACMILDELGVKGSWVLSGQEAVERVVEAHNRQQDYFAVFLDWQMPGMDGVETARAIRKAVGPEPFIAILSAYNWSDIEDEAREAGVDAFIGKPLFQSKVRSVLNGILLGHSLKRDTHPLADVQESDYTGKRVLLVEDNELNQEIAVEILGMAGLTVDVAGDGREGVDKFAASQEGYYSMVFMDIQMPMMNGYEATTAIRGLPREDARIVPIVAMTANAFGEDIQAALNAGMDEHIAKPLDFNVLAQTLRRWL